MEPILCPTCQAVVPFPADQLIGGHTVTVVCECDTIIRLRRNPKRRLMFGAKYLVEPRARHAE